jgi:hypothetical protein
LFRADYLHLMMLVEGIGVEAALPESGAWAAGNLCRVSSAAPLAPSRQALCRHVADVLTDSSDTLLARALGVRLGEKAGWSEARRAAVRAQTDAIHAVAYAPEPGMVDLQQPYSCDGVQRLKSYVDAVADRGEVQTLLASARPASAPR